MAVITLTSENFEKEVMQSDIPVIIDFWAPWCTPCRSLAPIIEMLAEDHEGKIKVCKVDVDEEQDLAAAFRVTSIPKISFIVNGKEENFLVGFRSKYDIEYNFGLNPKKLHNDDVFY